MPTKAPAVTRRNPPATIAKRVPTGVRRPQPTPITVQRGQRGAAASRGDQVVTRILDLVRSGNLKPGDRLPPERELIEIFSIGRPGLREALRSLATLGIIESRHGGGAYITDLNARRLLAPLDLVLSLTPSTLADSTECRRLIECEAVRKAAANMTAANLAEFEEMIEAHAKVVDDLVGFRILDSRFHGKIYALSNNAVLGRMAEALYNIGLDTRRQVMGEPGQIAKSTRDHVAIFRALKKGDPEAAVKAMEVHLQHIAQTTEALLARHG
jgi:GntR family transcriptional repressor for pyruvate dehydrogenase complex